MIHKRDILTKRSECGKGIKNSYEIEEIDCFDCLNIEKKEWERQVREFKGSPKDNAIKGLKRTEDRLAVLDKLNATESK